MNIRRSLATVSNSYRVFEEGQVLTHRQLNSLGAYADEQIRLSRVQLVGVGIAEGLEVSFDRAGGSLRITSGLGITSDGDLVDEPGTVFTHYQPFALNEIDYLPFRDQQESVPAWILTDDVGALAKPLAEFDEREKVSITGLVLVLFVENLEIGITHCTATDCDSEGREVVSRRRFLLLREGDLRALRAVPATAKSGGAALAEIVIPRPVLGSTVHVAGDLAGVYRMAANRLHQDVSTELRALLTGDPGMTGPLLQGVFAENPGPRWEETLERQNKTWANADTGIQYYYDFLKDLAETYNALYHLIIADRTCCNPDPGCFPKHLLLGKPGAKAASAEWRTPFFPSPILGLSGDGLARARFLIRKIDCLIQTFTVPSALAAIIITPSAFEDALLEERAIPWYYMYKLEAPIHRAWSFRRSKAGLEADTYGYRAAEYGARGAATAPLYSPLGPYPFFRIEGHLNRPASEAITEINQQIKSHNLPFAVRQVVVTTDPAKLPHSPGRYTDLHRLHDLMRLHLHAHLSDLKASHATMLEQIPRRAPAAGPAVYATDASQKQQTLFEKIDRVLSKLLKPFREYQPDWHGDIEGAAQVSSEIRAQVAPESQSQMNLFENWGTRYLERWLEWLDAAIAQRAKFERELGLFSKFIAKHIGAEHHAGVCRGGTFVLLSDESGKVIGDLMLPYIDRDDEDVELIDVIPPTPTPRPPNPPTPQPTPLVDPPKKDIFTGYAATTTPPATTAPTPPPLPAPTPTPPAEQPPPEPNPPKRRPDIFG